jgi:hypothetical protein|tara:strand:+ start:40 stop:210 length:171 start_codon:yes stop_codon:yes gene_type:complete
MSEVDIQGTIDIDGSVSKFSISNTEAWFQWGAEQKRLSLSVPIVEALQQALGEEEV